VEGKPGSLLVLVSYSFHTGAGFAYPAGASRSGGLAAAPNLCDI
jgi:hypothetical protein